jgi:hypothetical protein
VVSAGLIRDADDDDDAADGDIDTEGNAGAEGSAPEESGSDAADTPGEGA